MVLLGRI